MNGRVKSKAFAVIGTVTSLLWVTSATAASESSAYYQLSVGAGVLSDGASNTVYDPGPVQLISPALYVGGTLLGGGPGSSGYATGSAKAAPGVLGASAVATVFAENSVTTNTSGSAVAKIGSHYYEDVIITNTTPGALRGQTLLVQGSLLLSGNMNISEGTSPGAVNEYVQVGGSGINPLASSDVLPSYSWQLDMCGPGSAGVTCRVKSSTGAVTYSYGQPLVSQYEIPYAFYATSGTQLQLGYWLEVYGSASDSFGKCIDSLGGGQCDVYQQATPGVVADYSHTLLWNGMTVSDLSGHAINSFSVSSSSGFDYSLPASVPVPAAVWLFGSGLLGLAGAGRKTGNGKRQA